ncbi:MAG: 1-deoxy-D-xylulose-5-phosphate reductoisomerase [Endomicrobiales bacterium]|nr:1-deoxy-D-xylulose-5-phosphate reductoisomerase [Endomicrobiales bacterium]
MKKIVILGSSGSIGTQALDVIRKLGKKVAVSGLSAHSNVELFKKQLLEFKPAVASIWHENSAILLRKWCKENKIRTKIYFGQEGLLKLASFQSANTVLCALVGAAGLIPLIEAVKAGKTVALANKEALVIAGDIVYAEAKKSGAKIIPVDSEHSAIFQCLKGDAHNAKRIILTASGGPFYKNKNHTNASVEQALIHPTWLMGKKITIDSATLMNKGLEAIEAHFLFNMPFEKIEIVIHPQSVVHSLVEFVDGSTLAQMSEPDMRIAIQYAITYPERFKSCAKPLDLSRPRTLEFFPPDFRRFPCLELALNAGRMGGLMPVVLNAANEVAVELFLDNKIKFTDIAQIVAKALKGFKNKKNPALNDIIFTDAVVRNAVLNSYK